MQRLDGKVAVVTGGTKGVGRGVARELARLGARAFVTGRSALEAGDEKITGIQCDHRVDAEVEAAFQKVLREASTIDILVNSVWGGYERMVENGEFAGRAIAALAVDPDPLRHTGQVLVAAQLAMEYGFTDLDGTTPRPLTLADV